MPEPGDKLESAYRDLAREEPPASVDAAILAASRRAVASRPEAAPRRGFVQRFGAPISVAAVFVLGLAIALRMQVEQPGIESSMPAKELPAQLPKAAEEAKPAAAAPAAPPADALKAEPTRAQPPAPRAKAAAPARARVETPSEIKEEKRVDVARESVAPAPPPVPQQTRAFAPTPAAPPASVAAASAPAPAGAAPMALNAAPALKRAAAADAAGAVAASAVTTPESELERIAKLRAEGRDDEADKALEAFRKKYPDYRIAEAMWDRVRRK